MKQQTEFPMRVLLTLSVLLALASTSWARSDEVSRDRKHDARTTTRRLCEEECERQQPYFEEHLCRKSCEEKRGGVREVHDVVVANNEGDAEEEYDKCQEKCPGSGKKQWQCQRKCHDDYEATLERERETKHKHEDEHKHEREHEHEDEHEDEHHHGGGGKRFPAEHGYKHCLHKCEDKEEGFPRQRQCKLQCEQQFSRKHHQGEKHGHRKDYNTDNLKTKKEEKIDNPYYFDSQSFKTRYSTGEGQMKVLQRFSEKSDLLLGIDKFRVAFYEANPNSFMLPHHWDADSVLFIIKGKAAMAFLKQGNRQTFNLERGDVVMIPAGTTTYLVSTHTDEKLQIAELLRPVNTPGRYEQFFGVGGGESDSFFNSFSTEILQAALNIPTDELDKLLKERKEGAIIKASREQVKRMVHGTSRRQFGSSKGPFNMLGERPQMSNEHGEFYEVTPNDYHVLEYLDVSVAYCDIKKGSMMAPNYNSRTTYIVVVEEGSGYFEIASPHMEGETNMKQHDSNEKFEKVGSRLSKGDAFVVPAGHPLALLASENEGLRAIGFGINAQNNQRNFLAGQDNVINELDESAKELSFNLPAREVEEMFKKQRQSYFMAGPRRQQSALLSLLDFAGF